ncbi:sensor histidine kinase [Nocardiopsis oceani]
MSHTDTASDGTVGPAAPPVTGPGTGETEGPGRGGESAVSALTGGPVPNTRLARTLRRARRYCVWATAFVALMVPYWTVLGALISRIAPEDPPPGPVTELLAWAAVPVSVALAVLMFLLVRDRMDGRRTPAPRRYWTAAGLLVLVCALMWFTPYVFFVCASIWSIAVFLTPRERALRVTAALVVLPWLNLLFSPVDLQSTSALVYVLGAFLFAAFFGVNLALYCFVNFRLWDGVREATAGEQARSRLAVSEERLRFTEEMQGLLGHKLGALEAGARRAGQLVRSDPAGARTAIDGVHELARGTLRQVRSVVRGYRDIDLEDEVGSVSAVLAANGTTATVTGLEGLAAPPDTAALAAWVVREGGTNVLRHSDARRCGISFTVAEGAEQAPGELVVEITNDRAEVPAGDREDSGSGLAGLTERINRGGGTLAAVPTNDGGFLLRAVLPLSGGPRQPGVVLNENGATQVSPPGRPRTDGTPGTRSAGTSEDHRPTAQTAPAAREAVNQDEDGLRDTVPALTDDERRDRRIRTARHIITVVLGFTTLVVIAFPVLDVVYAPSQGLAVWPSAVGVLLSAIIAVLLIVLLIERMDGNRQPSPKLYWASLVLLAVTAVLLHSPLNAMFTIAAWWALGAFLAPRRTSVYVTVVLLLSPLPLAPTFFQHEGGLSALNPVLYALVWFASIAVALGLAATTLGMIWLWDITREAVAGQRARAQLAVTEERLRFARDMHDLLGHSLSALSVKAQLAGRLVDRAPDRAGAEMAEVQTLARQALQQVRSAVSGYREVDLQGEVDSAVSVLDSGGTRSTVTGLDGLDLPPKVAGLAAWVVREGGTNVMRHSDAEECQIGFTLTREGFEGPKGLVVEVYNDHARDVKTEASGGNGLAGLSERVALGGGTLSGARTKDGGFLLRAVIPL